MFSQNPARSIQDRPDENAVSPIDDIWDRATPDDSFGSDTEDSDEEGGRSFDQTHRIHFLAKNVPLYNASSV
ncbi:hypothetical protein AYX15_07061 [Cryptococcus neoformans]|nr:hypothetical protein AYX15_07061 [Cryptococcus neoformans var. grubii]